MHTPIWIDSASSDYSSRVVRVVFRRMVEVAERPAAATLQLHARMRYVVRVNGVEVGTGPVRSYPEFHEYDSMDLLPLLQKGTNQLEVEVLHWSMATFHNTQEAPGFEAWGSLVWASGEELDVSTPGLWKCRRVMGVDATAPRLSFAQPPVELMDFRKDADDAEWLDPVAAEPDPTPVMQPRSIPPLTRLEQKPAAVYVTKVAPSDRQILSARLTDDGDGAEPFSPRDSFGVLVAWVYAPEALEWKAGGWWGEYVLNGEAVAPQSNASIPYWQDLHFALRKGWNKLVVSQRLAFGYAEFCVSVPKVDGVCVKTAPKAEAPEGFRFLREAIAGGLLQPLLPLIYAEGETLPELGWETRSVEALHGSPLRNLAWAETQGECARIEAKEEFRIAAGTRAVVSVDMGKMVLARLSLEMDAPAGTVVDFGHAEECREPTLGAPRARIEKAVVVYGADRWIWAQGASTHTTISPRGFRYMDLLVDVPEGKCDAVIRGISFWEERYPIEEFERKGVATVAFDDADFAALWRYGKRTLELCSNDVFVDCPWRERTLYGGDLLPEMAGLVTFAEPEGYALIRHSVDVFLQSQGSNGWLTSNAPMPRPEGENALGEYPLLTSIAAGWYFDLTHDRAFAVRSWPVFQKMAETAAGWRTEEGVYKLPGRSFIDHGRTLGDGATCEFNAALVAAFRAWAKTAQLAGDAVSAMALRAKADALDEAVECAFYDANAKTYRDLPLSGGTLVTEGTPANSWALLFTRSAKRHQDDVVAALRNTLARYSLGPESECVSPYQMFFLLTALHSVGANALADAAIRIVYRKMLGKESTGTLWEHAGTGMSLVHAWSGGVVHYLAVAHLGWRECAFVKP